MFVVMIVMAFVTSGLLHSFKNRTDRPILSGFVNYSVFIANRVESCGPAGLTGFSLNPSESAMEPVSLKKGKKKT